jgi:hypothetical protein
MTATPSDRFPVGDDLRAEVERQLLADLAAYGVSLPGLWLDWSDCCQEGHGTQVMGDYLEDQSGILVRDQSGEPVAEGWMDFIHGGGNHPLFVFWLFLTLVDKNGRRIDVKENIGIPEHVWQVLPTTTRDLCAFAEGYDSRWMNDPLVEGWREER